MKFVYTFSEGNGDMRETLGGKGANLAEMTRLGLPVPQGFTVSTDACTRYYEDGERIAPEIEAEIFAHVAQLEAETGKRFGDPANPLLVSVRSGARASMPGMMDTILNLGINEEVAATMARMSGNPRWAYDCYRRFIQMFSDVAMGIEKEHFENLIAEAKAAKGVKLDTELDEADLRALIERYKALYRAEKGCEFPADPREQLMEAVKAVFRSWNNERAISYRRMNNIPGSWGTAVNVQSMVFGNMGSDCGTGVAFSRDPARGTNKLYAEYLMNAQGEDVVSGVRTPQTIEQMAETDPKSYEQLISIAKTLEQHYKDMQDMEFTIERGKLYMLQTRNGKRAAQAAFKIAVDLVKEGLCTKQEAILKIDPNQLNSLLHPTFDEAALKAATPIAQGIDASPGAAAGGVVFTAERAKELAKKGPVVLVRKFTSPEDIEGMAAAQGILTATGGKTSHAAVVAKGMGTCCVAGCGELVVYEEEKYCTVAGQRLNEGDFISIHGDTGKVYLGQIPTVEATGNEDYQTIMAWADEFRRLKVRTNADNPRDAAAAIAFGAEGIGLTRTEHMFFEADRIPAVREMIVSETEAQRRRALDKLLPMQRSDFIGIYRAMGDRPVTIRLLDPPLHEFLPESDEDIAALAKEMGLSFEQLKNAVSRLHETNPMMGHRGCRLAVTYPEIAEMQTRAIIEAAIEVKKEGVDLVPEIMIPLVSEVKEFRFMKSIVKQTADKLIAEAGIELPYLVGTMIEIPRAALLADEIAKEADFFSFGTNDLTQMTFGFSRDDAGKFLDAYYKKQLFEPDPFERIDQKGVGRLVEMACKLGRSANPALHLGICGEHGGDPSSVEFCHRTGLDYVSCSPFRVPIARLAAAQAAIKEM